jgi:hypothetical protein
MKRLSMNEPDTNLKFVSGSYTDIFNRLGNLNYLIYNSEILFREYLKMSQCKNFHVGINNLP